VKNALQVDESIIEDAQVSPCGWERLSFSDARGGLTSISSVISEQATRKVKFAGREGGCSELKINAVVSMIN